MHPLNKVNFGNATGSIKVHYNNGTNVETGWIVKQTSVTYWTIADSSTAENAVTDQNTFKCALTGTASPAAGQFTIYAYPVNNGTGVVSNTPVYVSRIDGHHVVASDGNTYIWTLASSPPTSSMGHNYAKLDTN